ncbi:MAG: Gfo/Idh/MocA family oxidoreductase [Saprospiraceae bacterium]
MDKQKVKIGVIGLGHLGKIHIKCIKQISSLELKAVWDIDKSIEQKVAEDENLICCDSIQNFFEAIEAVIIVSPTSTHKDWAVQCITAGKHIFIEKPVTATVADAEVIKYTLVNSKLKVQIGHVERFNPAFLAVQNLIDTPMFIEGHRLAEFKPRGTDVSVVMDLMIHDLDLILSMIKSPIKEIRASGLSVMSPTPDICNARLEFENGAVANLTASRISMKQMRKLRVFQASQYISMDLLKKESQVVKISDAAPIDHPFSWTVETGSGTKHIQVDMPIPPDNNAIVDELTSFADSILQDKSTAVTLDDGISALKVASLIQSQIESTSIQMA